MEPTIRRSHHTFFKLYVSVILTIIALLLAGLVGLLITGGMKLSDEAKTISNKADAFTAKVDTLNQNLENLNTTTSNANRF